MSFWGLIEDTRSMTSGEATMARSVFGGFLPYDDIYIGNKTGLGGAPWTEHSYNSDLDLHFYTLHMGPGGYSGCDSNNRMAGFGIIKVIFIHELTHVWQGHHSLIRGGYQARSLFAQLGSIVRTGNRNGAYDYSPGQSWDSYNVEQQANIVEDWFAHGASESDELFRYVRDNVRR